MNKILCVFCIVCVAFPLFAGGAAEGDINIGISKIVSHPALDAIEQGIKDELAELGVDVSYDVQNANGDISTAATIARKFLADRVNIAVGIATPAAQALVNAISDIPIIYTGVTDPVAAGLVESYKEGGANVTGVSDLTPVKEQITFLNTIYPVQTLGHIYSSGEDNAVILAEVVNETAKELSLAYKAASVTSSAEVRSAFLSIAGDIDALYVSTDNTVVSALAPVISIAEERGIAVMSADPSSAEAVGGILAAWGFDYYKMGRVTGALIADILAGKKTSEVPTIFLTDPADSELLINLDVAKSLDVRVPAVIVEDADIVIENGSTRRK